MNQSKFKKFFNIVIYIFAFIGFVLTVGYFAVKYGLTDTSGVIDNQSSAFLGARIENNTEIVSVPFWAKDEEWQVLKEAVIRDTDVINRAGKEADISPRLIVSMLVVEQLRLFYTERALFKEIFSPLKILGTQSQFSWGVMGIKPDTAKTIEENLKNPSSDFYPGVQYENLLDFKTTNTDRERFKRIVNEKDRYYSYLYGALYLKEVEAQWQREGFDIKDKPDILATLYNIGFANSKPNPEPQSGGSEIKIGAATYSFGSLAKEFYYSKELLEEFPR